MSNQTAPISLAVTADPRYARLVRMTAANVAMLSQMSVDKVEDVRMAAEEAFIYACSVTPEAALTISFEVDESHVSLSFVLASDEFPPTADDEPAAYADLILSAVCDAYDKAASPATLNLYLKADV